MRTDMRDRQVAPDARPVRAVNESVLDARKMATVAALGQGQAGTGACALGQNSRRQTASKVVSPAELAQYFLRLRPAPAAPPTIRRQLNNYTDKGALCLL